MWNQFGVPSDPLSKVQYLLLACEKGLKKWSFNLQKGRQHELNLKSENLKAILDREGSEVMDEIKTLRKEIHYLMDQEEL